MRNYNIRLEKYGISKNAFEELRAFCLQYPEKKRKVADAISIKSPNFSGMPHGYNVSDPTAKAAESIEKNQADIDLIEQTAKEVDDFLAPWLIIGVTQNVPTSILIARDSMPTSRDIYNQKRRQFYYLLALKKRMI